MKPKHSFLFIRSSLIATAALSSSAFAGDVFWDGSTDNDWNNADNWDVGRVPVKAVFSDNAIINTLTNFPVITAAPVEIPRDIKVGTVNGTTGRVDHLAGSVTAGSESQGRDWVVIGEDGGQGTYNLADTATTGGALTGFGTGSGSITSQQLRIARKFSTNVPTGEMSVNTSGTVKVFNDMVVGDGGSGTLNWDAGILDRGGSGGWMVVGQGGTSGNGTFNIGGGTINASGDTNVGLGSGSTGQVNLTGGTYNAGGFWVGRGGGTGTWAVSGANTQLTSSGEIYVGRETGSNGTLDISSGTVAVNNWFNVGRDGGTGTLEMSGGALTVERELRIGFGTGGSGTMNVAGGAQISAGTVSEHIVIGGDKGNGTATVSGTGTLVKSTNEFRVGNDDDSVGELTVTGGTVESGSWFGIGRNGSTGTLTISGTGVVRQGVTDLGSRLEMTNNNSVDTSAILNLDGGTLSTNGINSGGPNGTRNIFLNGGTLQARVNNLTFLQDMSNVTVKAGGAIIDTNGVNIIINQSINGEAGDGGLTKVGTGTMRLNGTNTYTGTTTVTDGAIGGTGTLSGPLILQFDGTIFPGAPSSGIGTFSAGNTMIEGIYSCGINGANSDMINVNGHLDLTSDTDEVEFLQPGAGATQPVYIIANYTTLSGTFDFVTDLPPGYTLTHSYNGGNQIAITRPLTAYESWLATFLPGETDPAIIGLDADPDGDGRPNKIEFALGGDPDNAADNPRVYQLTADSDDSGTQPELLMTVAVISGTPAFSGTPSPTASFAGVTYTIGGSLDLTGFGAPVSVVSPVTTGLPDAPAGYEYRTFSLDGSNGLPSRGFMRAAITP